MKHPILVLNTGSTSTRVGIFDGAKPLRQENIRHRDLELESFDSIFDQEDFRREIILSFLKREHTDLSEFSAVAARGGLLKPLASGTYLVNEKMVKDLREARRGSHASHLSGIIGFSLAGRYHIPCYIVDPVSVDEMIPLARYSGHALFERVMLSHALNMKAVAKRYAGETGKDYSAINLIVVHLGTGISVSVHHKGKMIDAVNPTEEGPFSMDRSGGLPVLQAARYICENNLSYEEFEKTIFGSGGIQSYLRTKDFKKVLDMIGDGNLKAAETARAMAYQVAKEVGGFSTVVNGKIHAILLTGSMAHSDVLTEWISERIRFLAPVKVYPGEDEMQALAEGVFRVIMKQEKSRTY